MARSYVESSQGSDRDEMDRSSKKQDDDGREFVICRLVARDFKPRREGRFVRGEAAKRKLFAYVAGVREKRREQGQDEEKHMFTDVKQAHFIAKFDQEEWVELPDEFKSEKGSARMGE